MEIVRDQFKLRPLVMQDKDSIALYLNNFKIFSKLRDLIPHPYSAKDAEWFINLNMHISPARNLTIEVDGKAVGVIGIVPKEDIYKLNAEIGYWLGEPFWGKGIMAEAVKSMTAYAFENFNIIRLYANVFEGNAASMRVLEKVGYTNEAIIKKSIIKNGEILDEYIYSLMKEDFNKRKTE